MRIAWMNAWLLAGVLASGPAWAEQPKSLDEQLLDDLETDLTPALEKPIKKPADKPPDASAPQPRDQGLEGKLLDEQLLDEIEGEDIDLGPQPDPLTRIGRNMRKVETLIDRHDTSRVTQEMQRQIVRDLEMLLEQTRRQCQGASSKSSSSSSPSQSNASAEDKPSEGEPSKQPARDSTDRLAKAGKTEAEQQQDLDALVEQVWGHLPDKVREQMQNVSVENFLPKYEKLIEEYYKRLAEEK